MYLPYVKVTSGNTQTTLDAIAKNQLGGIWSPPANAGAPLSTKGLGAQPVYKYVYYNSTSNPAPVAGPAPVYYTDESFTTVTGNAAEAFYTAGGNCIAGFLMPNTTSLATLTAAQLNQSYCFIQIGGLLVNAYAPTTQTTPAQGSAIVGLATGNWASSVIAQSAVISRQLGIQWTAITAGLCDVLIEGDCFWGS